MSTQIIKKERASQKLKQWIYDEGYSIEGLARKMNIHKQSLYNAINEYRTPSLEFAVKIEKMTKGKIKPIDWVIDLESDKKQTDDPNDRNHGEK